MKVTEAVQFYLQYKKANAKGNSLKNYRYILHKFENYFGERAIDTITTAEIISFLTGSYPKQQAEYKAQPLFNPQGFFQPHFIYGHARLEKSL